MSKTGPEQPMPIHAAAKGTGLGAMLAQALWSLVQPVWVIRNCWRTMPLGKAYLLHLYGLAIACTGLVMLDILTSMPYLEDTLLFSALTGDRYAVRGVFYAALYFVLATQLGYPIAAFATMCWGAGPEPWVQSYARSLARWWQLTPHQALAGLIFVGTILLFEEDIIYWDNVEYLLLGLTIFVYVAYQMWITLRALAVHELPGGWPGACRWPLMCEGCGYSLAGQPMDQGCSECGRPVAESAECGRGSIALMKPVNALFFGATHPKQLGRILLAFRPSAGTGKAMAYGSGLLLLTGPMGVAIAFIIVLILNFSEFDGDFVEADVLIALASMSIYAGTIAMAGAVGFALLVGSLIGTFYAIFIKRPVMHVAAQAAAYTSATLPLWILANWVGGGLLFGTMILNYSSGGPAWAVLIPAAFFLGNLASGILYVVLVSAAVKAARWANA